MVKKLKKGSNITTSAPQKGQVKKRKIQAKEEWLKHRTQFIHMSYGNQEQDKAHKRTKIH
jgi:hypothetical protein